MGREVEYFIEGSPEALNKLNALVDAIKSLQAMTGDQFIRVNKTPVGIAFSLNFNAIRAQTMKLGSGKGGSGIGIRRAFVRTTPGATTTLLCYLDNPGDSAGGVEISVECHLYGGGNLDEAHPSFVVDDPLWVAYNSIDGEWQNVTRIDGTEECLV